MRTAVSLIGRTRPLPAPGGFDGATRQRASFAALARVVRRSGIENARTVLPWSRAAATRAGSPSAALARGLAASLWGGCPSAADGGARATDSHSLALLSPQEIRYRWPYLRTDDLRGGTFCPWEGYAGPYEALTGYAKGARKKGVKIHENTEVQKILVENGKVTGVATPKGHISAPIIINAAGPYAEEVGKMAGVEIPVKPYRRQIFFTAAFPWIQDPIPLVIDFHRGWYFRREGEGLLISGPKDEYPSFNVCGL